jgi:hypothetical protein
MLFNPFPCSKTFSIFKCSSCHVPISKLPKLDSPDWETGWSGFSRLTKFDHQHYLCKVYNYHDSQAYSYKRSEILSRLDGLGVKWFGFGLAV